MRTGFFAFAVLFALSLSSFVVYKNYAPPIEKAVYKNYLAEYKKLELPLKLETFINESRVISKSKNNGGIIPNPQTGSSKFEVSELDQTLFFTIDKLKVGEISEPVLMQSQDGKKAYRLIYLKSRSEPHRANPDELLSVRQPLHAGHDAGASGRVQRCGDCGRACGRAGRHDARTGQARCAWFPHLFRQREEFVRVDRFLRHGDALENGG